MRTRLLPILLCVFVTVGLTATAAAQHAEPDVGGHGDVAAHGAEAPGDAHGDDHARPPLLSFDPGAAVWTIIVFVALMILLRAVAWKPILKGLQQRETFIRDSLDQAKQDRAAAEAKLAEYTAQIDKGRDEAGAIVEQARRDAEITRVKIKETAQDEAESMLVRAKSEIELARKAAVRDVYEAGAQLATSAAGKIIGREVDAVEHERLIAESIEELSRRRN